MLLFTQSEGELDKAKTPGVAVAAATSLAPVQEGTEEYQEITEGEEERVRMRDC